jgi:hypothetical protein
MDKLYTVLRLGNHGKNTKQKNRQSLHPYKLMQIPRISYPLTLKKQKALDGRREAF